jgi:hypothetical protein
MQDIPEREHLTLSSQALSRISFSQRRRALGLEKEALATALEACTRGNNVLNEN